MHIADEAITLYRVLEKVESARKLRLVILDACRNNPFAVRGFKRGGQTRSISRGLPSLEPEGDIMVAYATKHGNVALDGEDDNSPFAKALVAHMLTPNLDVRVMFGRVRDDVRRATGNQQDPWLYGSLGGDLHYFALASR